MNPIIVLAIVVLLGLLVLYYALVVRAILEMLRLDVNKILLTFAFLSLIVLPPTLLLGIFILIIWHYHKKTISTPAGTSRSSGSNPLQFHYSRGFSRVSREHWIRRILLKSNKKVWRDWADSNRRPAV